MNDEDALKIGRHVLNQYAKWTENPRGKAVVIPVLLESNSSQPPWAMDVRCEMPWFIENYWEDGKFKTKHWSLEEWMKK